MEERRPEAPKRRLWRSSRRLLVSLVGVAFVVGFVGFFGAVAYTLIGAALGSASSWRDLSPSAVVGIGVVFYVLGQLGWTWGKDAWAFFKEAAPPVVEDAREVVDASNARREERREREARQDSQGGALSISEAGRGGELGLMEPAEGGIDLVFEGEGEGVERAEQAELPASHRSRGG